MIPKRRPFVSANAGLLAALALGTSPLAGCAAFDPDPAVPAHQAVGASQATVVGQPTTQVVRNRNLMLLVGTARVGEEPLANAAVQVVDLLTDRPVAGVITVTTDASGKFELTIAPTVLSFKNPGAGTAERGVIDIDIVSRRGSPAEYNENLN